MVFARVHVLQTSPEQSDAGLEIFREQLLPWLRDASGYRGLIRLVDRGNGKTLVISLWSDEQALQASTEAGERLAELTAETVGATRLAVEQYEATIFDV
jgi:heme-degrading monooxygenase HmoA